MPKIVNLRGVFKCSGFEARGGRFPSLEDANFVPGPCELAWDNQGRIIDPSASRGAIFDGTGLIATPGFVDSHTHSLFSGDRSFEYARRWQGASYQSLAAEGGGILKTQTESASATELDLSLLLEKRLLEFVSLGTTTVEIKSGYGQTAQEELRQLRLLKKICDRESKFHPRVLKTFLGLHALPKNKEETHFVDSMIQLLPTIASEKLAEFVDAFPEEGFFSLDSARRFVHEATRVGLAHKIHADEISDMDAARTFAESGAYSVDHLQCISSFGIEALKRTGTVACLLPATSFYLKIPYTRARTLIDSGIPVALASDFNPGTAPNPSLMFSALLALSEYKMSASEILCACTFNGAKALGIDDAVGVLTHGKCADILLWNVETQNASPEHFLFEIFVQLRKPHKVILRGLL